MELPEQMEGTKVFYESEEKEAAVIVEEGGKVVIPQLAAGDYKIRIPDTKDYEFQSIEVRVPTWDVVEEKMMYDITIEPKYQKIVSTPQTGDQAPVTLYVVMSGIALMTIAMCIWMARQKETKK